MNFGNELNKKMKEKGINQATLAKEIGIPKTTLNSMIKNNVNKIDIDVFLRICKVLNCNPEEFYNELSPRVSPKFVEKYNAIDEFGRKAVNAVLDAEYERCTTFIEEREEEQPTITINYSFLPASAGTGEFLSDEYIEQREYPDTPTSRQADIVIPVSGKSMEPKFYDGDELYVRLQPAVNIGEIGVFMVDGKGYVKNLYS